LLKTESAAMRRDEFRGLMGETLIAAVESDGSTTFGVWDDGTLAYVNQAWSRMALDNGGAQVLDAWPLGRSVWEAIPDVLARHYQDLWQRALDSGQPCKHDYECSSPELHRVFRMQVHPLGRAALLIRNHPVVERPYPGHGAPLRGDLYTNVHGLITMCANCRRVRTVLDSRVWDWVPELVAHTVDNVTHGLCESCLELYYPQHPRPTV